MKKTAAILLLIFALVQACPVIYSICSSKVYVLIVDEEKAPEKYDLEKENMNKDYLAALSAHNQSNTMLLKVFCFSEYLHLFPIAEKPTPPPNFYF